MSAKTAIQWTDRTWNPVRGCSIVSPGCTNCYAMKQAKHVDDMFASRGKPPPYAGTWRLAERGPIWTGKIRLAPEALGEPLHWRKPQKVFVNSMSDLFHEDVPFEFVACVFHVMALARKHTFQILTKRPQRMRQFVAEWFRDGEPDPNVWLGVSVENQATADERIPILLETPAAVRFLSVEPLLESVNISGWFNACATHGPVSRDDTDGDTELHRDCDDRILENLDWVIVGGESGSGARPCNIDWIRSIVAQCKAAAVACFVKQGGSSNACLHDRKGGHLDCQPVDLQVREFPNAV